MTEVLQELGETIARQRPDCVLEYNVIFGELNIEVAPSNIVAFIEFLKIDSS